MNRDNIKQIIKETFEMLDATHEALQPEGIWLANTDDLFKEEE